VNPRVEHARLPPGDPISRTNLAAFFRSRDAVRDRMMTALADSAAAKPDAVRAIQ